MSCGHYLLYVVLAAVAPLLGRCAVEDSDSRSVGVDAATDTPVGGDLPVGDDLPRDADAPRPDTAPDGPREFDPGETTPLPEGVGWTRLENTKLRDVCPGDSDCSGVIRAWSGGIADTLRNRLIIWGGGHRDYDGNELYSLNLAQQTLTRLNDPSPENNDGCITTLSDGTPNSRHTYEGLAYIADADRMFAYGGSLACDSGEFGDDTWTLDLQTLAWERMEPESGPRPPAMIPATGYDPQTRRVLLHTQTVLHAYDFETNTYTLLNDSASTDYHMSGVVDPDRRLFLLFGGGEVRAFDISDGSDYEMQVWDREVSDCGSLPNQDYPGLAYDPIAQRVVGWPNRGGSIYLFDPDTQSCTRSDYPDGPPDPGFSNGVDGRFRYFPDLDIFAVVVDWDVDAYILRTRPE